MYWKLSAMFDVKRQVCTTVFYLAQQAAAADRDRRESSRGVKYLNGFQSRRMISRGSRSYNVCSIPPGSVV